MGNDLQKKYGLPTAIALVVGIVIGSGVFFKAEKILTATGGNLPLGILAWAIGGLIMIICAYMFSILATRYAHVNGLVDYAEALMGKRYAYYMGWFTTFIYFPAMTSVLAWVSARYLGVLCGFDITGGPVMVLACLFLVGSYAVNALSPILAGKFQVATTVIKLIPLALMAVVGIIYGLMNGMTAANFTTMANVGDAASSNPLLAAVCATSFAYEGWIIATAINAELKDSKKNLPRALVIGGIIIIAVYIAYYVGVAGGATNQELIDNGATVAFVNIFGNVLGNILNLFIAISCMGTMNGLMLGCCRGMYSVAARGEGICPNIFVQVDKATNLPNNSAVLGLFVCAAWGLYFFLANLANSPLVGKFVFDSSEIPIVTIYAMYLPIFVMWMKKAKDESIGRRFIIPILAFCGAAFMVFACIIGHKFANVYYLIVFAVIMVIGGIFRKNKKGAAV